MNFNFLIPLLISILTASSAAKMLSRNKSSTIFLSLLTIILLVVSLISYLDKNIIPLLEAMK
jgi:positive regulator of sigma E activity